MDNTLVDWSIYWDFYNLTVWGDDNHRRRETIFNQLAFHDPLFCILMAHLGCSWGYGIFSKCDSYGYFLHG